MISTMRNGVQGMEKAADLVNAAASDISKAAIHPKQNASTAAPESDITRDVVNLVIGHRTYDANAKVIEVAARMLDEIV